MTESSTLTFQGNIVKCSIPKELYLAIAKIQVDGNMEWDEACEKSAELMSSGSRVFEKRVNKESRRRFDSTLMKQLNKSRDTIRNSAYESGYEKARKDHRIWYFCSSCGK